MQRQAESREDTGGSSGEERRSRLGRALNAMLRHLPLLSRQQEAMKGSRVLWGWITGRVGSQANWGDYHRETGKCT